MKKTMRFLSMAALALVGAVMTGCSSDEDFADFQQPEKKGKVVTLTTTISLDGGAATRALDASNGKKTFKAGERIAVYYEDANGDYYRVNGDNGEVSLTNISADGKTASFTVTMTDPKPNGKLRYVYPGYLAEDIATNDDINDDGVTIKWYEIEDWQFGTISDLEEYSDLAVFDGTLTAEGTLPTEATLKNKLAILAINFKDGDTDVTASIEVLTITDGTNNYEVYVDDGDGGQSTIYVAIRPTTSADITVSAWDDADEYDGDYPATYTKDLTGKTYAASNWYNVTWQVGVPLLSLTVTDPNNIVGGPKIIYYAEGETWKQAIENHPEKNAGWGIDSWNEVIYTYNGDPWTVCLGNSGEYGAFGNDKINGNTSYYFWN